MGIYNCRICEKECSRVEIMGCGDDEGHGRSSGGECWDCYVRLGKTKGKPKAAVPPAKDKVRVVERREPPSPKPQLFTCVKCQSKLEASKEANCGTAKEQDDGPGRFNPESFLFLCPVCGHTNRVAKHLFGE